MKFSKNEQFAFKKGYRITEKGEILNPQGVTLSGSMDMHKYNRFKIDLGGRNFINIRTHRLQAYQKYGDKIYEKGIEVRHLDGNPSNNHIDNIAIGSHSDNMMDKAKEVRVRVAQQANLKYDRDEVRAFHAEGNSYKKIMEKFGISSKGTVSDLTYSRL